MDANDVMLIKQMIHEENHRAHMPDEHEVEKLRTIKSNYLAMLPMFKRGKCTNGDCQGLHKNTEYSPSLLEECDGCGHDIPKQLGFCPFCDDEDGADEE